MHAEHTAGIPRVGGDVAYGNRRRIAREDRVGPREDLDLRQHRAFEVEVFVHRLDHQIGTGEAGVVGRPREQGAQSLELRAGELATLETLGENRGRHTQALSHPGQLRVLEPGVHLDLEYRRAGDACTHEAGADDAETADLPGDGAARRNAVVFLERRRGEEHLHQFPRHVSHRKLAERAMLL